MSNHVLITYFTHSGNTRKIAKLIHEKAGGELFEIHPKIAYPDSYDTVVEQAKKEIRGDYRPALESQIDNLESYNTVFVGSPNWWNTIASPVAAFLSESDLSGKTIVPFCTHGGGNAQSKVTAWLQRIGVVIK